MVGHKSGVEIRVKAGNIKMLSIHCFRHVLSMSVNDLIKNVELMKNTLDNAKEICNLVKKSPKRNTKLNFLQVESRNTYKSVHDFCRKRWAVNGETFGSFCNNHAELMNLWEWSLDNLNDREMKARIQGVQSQMRKFEFLFDVFWEKRF